MKGKRGKRPSQHAAKRRKGPAVWSIVLLNQEPIRRKASADCQREMKRLEKARAEWKRFEQEDRPAFERWRAVTLGPLMSVLREIGEKIHEKEQLIDEVEAELGSIGTFTYQMAYERVMLRRERAKNPPSGGQFATGNEAEACEGEHDNWSSSEAAHDTEDEDADAQYSDFEIELLFEDFALRVLGVDPDRLSDRDYATMLAAFRKKVHESQRKSKGAREPLRDAARSEHPKEEKPSRLKELYRLLVRRLHPDMRADSDRDVSALWHDVQEAYASGNAERLEMLIAFTEMEADSMTAQTTVGQMLAVLTELRRSLHALLRTLSNAKRELAWGFLQLTDRTPLERRLKAQMERDIASRRQQLQDLQDFIASWTETKRKRPKRRAQPQDEFSF